MTDIGFTWLDGVAIALLLACWGGLTLLTPARDIPRNGGDDTPTAPTGKWISLTQVMGHYRYAWMEIMGEREMRMIDTMIQGSVLQGCTFFASTSILLVGGLLTLLGATDSALGIVQALPFVAETTRALWEIKVLSIVVMLTYAFFKFAWAHRLYTYCIVVIGATPIEPEDRTPDFVTRAARLLDLGATHYNRGIRVYYYVLAAITWFLHPGLFIASTLWVTAVLLRREFRSRTRAILLAGPD